VQPALHNIANAYAQGRGVTQSDHNALLYYEAGAEAGDPYSLFTLGTWYYRGRGGLKENKYKSFELQLKAAEAGHPAAMFNVGTAYITGDGIGKTPTEGVKWLEQAAQRNVLEARLNLAKAYMDGPSGLQKDLHKARELVSTIAHRHPIAKQLLDEIEYRIEGNL
jgi:TPR repeat protein